MSLQNVLLGRSSRFYRKDHLRSPMVVFPYDRPNCLENFKATEAILTTEAILGEAIIWKLGFNLPFGQLHSISTCLKLF